MSNGQYGTQCCGALGWGLQRLLHSTLGRDTEQVLRALLEPRMVMRGDVGGQMIWS